MTQEPAPSGTPRVEQPDQPDQPDPADQPGPAEFGHLSEEAAEWDISTEVPFVSRVEVATAHGRVSSLLWGHDPGVTLLHGGGLNAHTWDATLLALGRPALAVDLPGHGWSAWRDDFDYSAQSNAPAVAEVIDQLTDRPQVVVGQSLGGTTAIALSALRPDLVSGLVIVDVSPGLRPEDAAQVLDFLGGPLVFSSREEIVEAALAAGIGSNRSALARGVALNTRIRDDGAVVFLHHLGSPPPGASRLPVDFTSLWAPLEDSELPVLLIRGTTGYLPPERVEEFRTRVPRARIVDIEAGHNVQEQQPVLLAAELAAFLETDVRPGDASGAEQLRAPAPHREKSTPWASGSSPE
jgi:pimeloyl-ACP methyl ester carboxylesterase